jgi:hypothetical protein
MPHSYSTFVSSNIIHVEIGLISSGWIPDSRGVASLRFILNYSKNFDYRKIRKKATIDCLALANSTVAGKKLEIYRPVNKSLNVRAAFNVLETQKMFRFC